jgi:(p)ppGpp synthase/HD superfamily hydrolase
LTNATLDDALALVIAKFHGVTDKAGQPYILHCLRVMLGVSGALTQQVAVMHDLVEDTDVTLADLQDMKFADEVIEALKLVTHVGNDSYANYVVRLKANPRARQVKLADLHDNYSLARVAYREGSYTEDACRIQRYILSYQFLTDLIDESTYRQQMASVE